MRTHKHKHKHKHIHTYIHTHIYAYMHTHHAIDASRAVGDGRSATSESCVVTARKCHVARTGIYVIGGGTIPRLVATHNHTVSTLAITDES